MRHELTATASEAGDRAANNRAARLHRVILAGVSACLLVAAAYLSQASNARAQTAPASTDYCWIDAATGERVETGPLGWDPNPGSYRAGNNPDANHVEFRGHNYVKQPDGTWIDAATGSPVETGPPGWDTNPGSIRAGNNPDANHVEFRGHTYVRVPCPPPAGGPASAQSGQAAQPQPETGSSVPGFGFGFGFGGFGRGQDRSRDNDRRP